MSGLGRVGTPRSHESLPTAQPAPILHPYREARDLLAEGTKLGLSPAAVEAALAAADGDWEQAWWELQQAHSAAQAPSLAGSAASSAAVVAPVAASSAQMSRQGSTASSSAAAVSSHLLGSSWAGAALGAPAAAALPAGLAASSSTALNEWGSQDPQLASATSAWRQPVQPAASAASAGAAIGYDDGFAAGMAAALQGLQQQPDASAAAALAGEQPPAAPAPDAAGELLADTDAYGWVPPPQERPPASDAEHDFYMSLMCLRHLRAPCMLRRRLGRQQQIAFAPRPPALEPIMIKASARLHGKAPVFGPSVGAQQCTYSFIHACLVLAVTCHCMLLVPSITWDVLASKVELAGRHITTD